MDYGCNIYVSNSVSKDGNGLNWSNQQRIQRLF